MRMIMLFRGNLIWTLSLQFIAQILSNFILLLNSMDLLRDISPKTDTFLIENEWLQAQFEILLKYIA